MKKEYFPIKLWNVPGRLSQRLLYLSQHFCLFSVSEHWNGGLKSFVWIRWRYKYTWIYFSGKSQIIIKDKNHLGDIDCCGTELCFMGNEKKRY